MGLEEVAPFGVVECGVVFVDQHAVNDELSGWAESNRRPSGPKPDALPSCATPRAADGAKDVAVAAHEPAFLQLREDECTAPTSDQVADRCKLLVSRSVIPVHHPHGEPLATVRARARLLDCS